MKPNTKTVTYFPFDSLAMLYMRYFIGSAEYLWWGDAELDVSASWSRGQRH